MWQIKYMQNSIQEQISYRNFYNAVLVKSKYVVIINHNSF